LNHAPLLKRDTRRGKATAKATGERDVYFGAELGFERVAVYQRENLGSGATIHGPAIVEQFDSTIVLPPETRAVVDPYHNLVVAC
jgi:N-methylhydantoinase A